MYAKAEKRQTSVYVNCEVHRHRFCNMHFYTDVCFILIMVSDACNELKRTLADGNAISAVKRFTKKYFYICKRAAA